MIVARVASAAEAVLKAFSDSGIMDVLQRSMNISAARANYPDPQYAAEINKLRNEAKKIADSDFIHVFPKDIWGLIRS